MKKIFSAALLIFVFALAAPGQCTDKRREFISKTIHSDVQKLLKNSGREIIGVEPFSSQDNNVTDYMISFYNTNYGLLVTLQTLEQRLDDYGRVSPDVYSSEFVAIVFVDKSLLWYQSETAKSILKAKMAQLMGKQSI